MLDRAFAHLEVGEAAAADEQFHRGGALRPWGRDDIELMALHAYAAAVRNGHPEAAGPGSAWLAPTSAARVGSAAGQFDAGTILEGIGDLAGAAAALEESQRLDPNNPRTLIARGIVAVSAGDLTCAEALLVRATQIVPSSPDPWHNLAILYRMAGQVDRASSAQRRAEELSRPQSPTP